MKKETTKKVYTAPKLVKLGDIGTVTQALGSHGGGSCGSASICNGPAV
jgi:hypothetical protein